MKVTVLLDVTEVSTPMPESGDVNEQFAQFLEFVINAPGVELIKVLDIQDKE